MKKTLCVLLVLALVAVSAFAEPTFSGEFYSEWGYDFPTSTPYVGGESGVNTGYLSLSLKEDYYTLNLSSYVGSYVDANVVMKVSDILEKEMGLDLNGFGIQAAVGNTTWRISPAYAYGKITSNFGRFKLTTVGANIPGKLTLSYNGFNVVVVGDIIAKDFGAEINGAVSGISFDAAFQYKSKCIGASVKADITKFVDMEGWTLYAAGITNYYLDDSTGAQNIYGAQVVAGKDQISGFVEYRNVAKTSSVWGNVAYKLSDMVTVGTTEGYTLDSESTFKENLSYKVYADLSVGGIDFEAGFANEALYGSVTIGF